MGKTIAKLDPARAQVQLKVTVRYIRPAICRRLSVPAKIKPPKFHSVLQAAFGRTDSHLRAFRVGDESNEAYYPETWEEPLVDGERNDESKFRLCDLLHGKGDWLIYEYDFGDGWQHEVRIEKAGHLPGGRTGRATRRLRQHPGI